MLKVLIYQPNFTGHHFSYLGKMLPGFRGLPIELGLVTSPQAIKSDEFKKCIAPHSDFLETLPWCRPPAKWTLTNAYRRYVDLHRSIVEWDADHVCVAYADGIWQLEAIRSFIPRRSHEGKVTLEGWIFRGGFAYPTASKHADSVKRWLFARLLQRGIFSKLHLQDELLQQYASTILNSKTELVLAADPIQLRRKPTHHSARVQLGIPADERSLIACIGMVDRRKGVQFALEAFLNLTESRPQLNVSLVLAGPHHQEIRSMLLTPSYRPLVESGSIISIDRFISSEEMLLVAEASDLVLAPYPNHSGRSSIVLWAAAAGTRVLAVNRGCIKHVVETEKLGATCDVMDSNLFSFAIGQSLTSDWTEEDRSRCRTYAAWHSIENYQKLSTSLVQRHLREAGEI